MTPPGRTPQVVGQLASSRPKVASTAARFGTVEGVFTPCTLTILGVIMFLRFGYCVGQAGVRHAIAIVLISKAITTLTALSLSAIATNTRPKGGGAYYLISRSLGVEFGSAIGIVFFLAQAVSVAMYVIGFSEALKAAFPGLDVPLWQVATAVNVAVFVSVFIGAGWAIRLQYGILATLVVSLLSFYVGAIPSFDPATLARNLAPGYEGGQSFFTVFAVFFPAVTGIMAGANLSGDLRDPARSIPRGTLASIGVTGAIYGSLILALAGAAELPTLRGDSQILAGLSQWPALITAGVLAATLSSALGSMMGAPRILQAFARDDVLRWTRVFARGSGSADEPRYAIVLTFGIAQAAVSAGDLNALAPIITMFFLITYGMLNFATFTEAITGNPSYRPRFRLAHWSLSLLGALGCLAVMFLVDPLWALGAVVAMATIHRLLSRRQIRTRWGDVNSGSMYDRARRNLLRLEDEKYHPKNWRPTILALRAESWESPRLAVLAQWLTGGRGALSVGRLMVGSSDALLERQDAQHRALRRFLRAHRLSAFPVVVVAHDVVEGIRSLLQCHGLGGLRPNTALIEWDPSADEERRQAFIQECREVTRMGRSLLAVRRQEDPADAWHAPPGTVDVWWSGGGNGSLMLLLAHLLSLNAEWRGRTIRLLRVIGSESGVEQARKHLADLAEASRIEASAEIVVATNVPEAIRTTSADAAITFIGFSPMHSGGRPFAETMELLSEGLHTVVFTHSEGGMELDV